MAALITRRNRVFMKPLNNITLALGEPVRNKWGGTSLKFNGYYGITRWLALVILFLGLAALPVFAQTSPYTFVIIAGSSSSDGSSDGPGTNALFYNPQGAVVDTNYNVYVTDTGNNTIRAFTYTTNYWTVSTIAGFPDPTYTVDDFSSNGVGPQNPQNQDYYTTSNNYAAGQITSVYTNWFGTALGYVVFSLSNVNNNPANGSMQINLDWTPGSQFALHHADYSDNPGVSSLTYTSVEMDVRWDPSSVTGTGNVGYATFGPLRLGVRPHAIYNIQDWFYTTNIPASMTNWVHINAPLSATDTNQENWGELLIGEDSSILNSELNGVATLYVDNIRFIPKPTSGSNDGMGTNALFNGPVGITTDSRGNLYIADTLNNTIRKLSLSGTNWTSSTMVGLAGTNGSADGSNNAALFYNPKGITVDAYTNIYVADTLNDTIRKIVLKGTNWVATTIGGQALFAGSTNGIGTNALFNSPEDIAVDAHTNLYIADSTNNLIRELAYNGTNWISSTLAGSGIFGINDGPGVLAEFGAPGGIAVDISNNLYVADTGNQTIRKLTFDGTNWMVTTLGGQPGTAGHASGYGASALFANPKGVSVDHLGQVFVADGDTGSTIAESAILGGIPLGTLVNNSFYSAAGQVDVYLGPIAASNSSGAWGISYTTNGSKLLVVNPLTNSAFDQKFPAGGVVVFSNIFGWYLPTNQLITNPPVPYTTNLYYIPQRPVFGVWNGGLWLTGIWKTSYTIEYTTNLTKGVWHNTNNPMNIWSVGPMPSQGAYYITNWPPPVPAPPVSDFNRYPAMFYRAQFTNE